MLQIERQLGNIERVRTLYEKYLEWSPANCTAWCKFAEVEQQYLGEIDRARAIYELAIAQPVLDMPEVLWKVTLHEVGLQLLHFSAIIVLQLSLQPWDSTSMLTMMMTTA